MFVHRLGVILFNYRVLPLLQFKFTFLFLFVCCFSKVVFYDVKLCFIWSILLELKISFGIYFKELLAIPLVFIFTVCVYKKY